MFSCAGRRPHRLIAVLLCISCQHLGCSQKKVDITADAITSACLAYAACSESADSVDGCLEQSMSLLYAGRWGLQAFHFSGTALLALVLARDCVEESMGDCDAVWACIGGEPMGGPASCESKCEGNVLVTCVPGPAGEGFRVDLDCGMIDQPCNVTSRFVPVPQMQAACAELTDDPTSGERTCEGDVWRYELVGFLASVDCAETGSMCTQPAGFGCQGRGGSCEDDRLVECDQDVLMTCRSLAWEAFDCRSLGMRCAPEEPFGASCQPDGCTFGSLAEPCQGTELTFCGYSGLTTVDCADLGFVTCVDGRCAS